MLEFPEQVVVEAVDGAMKLSFSLPSGTFATSLLAELTGDLQDAGGVETDERPADGESDRADTADRD